MDNDGLVIYMAGSWANLASHYKARNAREKVAVKAKLKVTKVMVKDKRKDQVIEPKEDKDERHIAEADPEPTLPVQHELVINICMGFKFIINGSNC